MYNSDFTQRVLYVRYTSTDAIECYSSAVVTVMRARVQRGAVVMRTCAVRRLVGPVGTVVLAVAVLVQSHASAVRLAHELGNATAQRQPGGADQ